MTQADKTSRRPTGMPGFGLVAAAVLFGVTGRGVYASDESEISGPPVINPAFGSRMPRQCNPVTHVPNPVEAAALVQCASEKGGEPGAFRPLIYLWQNVRVQIGTSRPYAYNSDSRYSSIDPTIPVYPIRVTADHVSCTGEPNCKISHTNGSAGACYQTTFGDWSCHFSQDFDVNSTQTAPPPTTF